MCGIFGYISKQQNVTPEVKHRFATCIKKLHHRGPDHQSISSPSPSVLMGHTRLALIDLSADANQPFVEQTGRYTLVFNGEIYNYLELKNELKELGYTFTTTSDTEVLLTAYRAWGDACQKKFNGMWAFAIWDAKKHTLFLSRDRYGIKPLYIYNDETMLAFSSEIAPLAMLLGETMQIDERAVYTQLTRGERAENIRPTIIQGVEKVLPGECITFSHGHIATQKWWRTLDHLPELPKDDASCIAQFQTLFEDACRLRMRADVPLGAALSGGLDSSSVVAQVATKFGTGALTAFIADFPDTAQDETHFATALADYHKVPYQKITLTAEDAFTSLSSVIQACEEGFELPTGPYLLYERYKQNGIKISLDGHGADELFGGYISYPLLALGKKARSLSFRDWGESLRVLQGMTRGGVLAYGAHTFSQKCRSVLKRSPRGIHALSKGMTPYVPVFQEGNISHLNPIEQQLFTDFHYNTLPAILRRFDRCSMAHGVEVRSPFLDYRMVSFAHALPLSYKLNGGFSKYIVRKAMKPMLPNTIRLRKKKLGFTNPSTSWFASPELKTFMLDTADSHVCTHSPLFDGKSIRSDIEYLYKVNDMRRVQTYWPYIHMTSLIKYYSSLKENVQHSFFT